MRWLQYFNRGFFPGFHRDIAKAYVTAKLAHEMKDDYTINENIVKRIEVQLKEADWKEIKRLQDEGYPTAPKFKEEARKLILASGFKLPEEKPEASPENENLKQ
jgi:basic membrane lipoprotein Med (substrate-binding protein (PBP1-ABC) superfamily)